MRLFLASYSVNGRFEEYIITASSAEKIYDALYEAFGDRVVIQDVADLGEA